MAADGGYMDSRLPEDMGIGALPERSLSGMADGGIVGFAAGGNPKGKKLPSFDDALDAEGVRDPRQRAFLKALYGQESGSGADTTTSNQGAVGHMQIKPSTFKQVADKGMDINNPFDNMRAGIRYGMQGYQAANGDPVLAGAHYYGGPGGMEALAKGQVRTDSKNPKAPNTLEYGKSIAQRMTALLPIGSAQAQTAPAPTTEPAPAEQGAAFGIYPKSGARTVPVVTAEDKAAVAAADAARAAAVAQIPGGSGGTPAPAPVDTRTIFGKGADYLGVPEGFQREFSNTLNALGGYSSPVAAAKSMGAADELAATPEMIAKAAAAKRVAETPRLLPPVKAGIAALPQEAQTLRAEAEAARRARLLAEDQKAAVAAENSVNAANATSKIASEVEAANLAKQTAAAANAAKVAGAANVAKTGALAQGVAQGVATDTSSGYEREPYSTGEYRGKSGIADIDIGPAQAPLKLTPEVKKEAVALAKAEIPKEERSGFGYEDLLMFGLNLMAGQSPNALTNVGTAGVAALTAKQARTAADQKSKFAEREADREERKTTAAVKSADALSRKYGAEALALEADTKTDSAMRMKAAALAQQDLQDWAKLPANFTATPAQVNAKRSELMRTYFDLLGQASTMGAAGGKTGNPLVDKYLQ